MPAATVAAQAEAVLGDIGADAIKTGMFPDAETVEAVAGSSRGGGRRKTAAAANGDENENENENETTALSTAASRSSSTPSSSRPPGDPLASGGVASAMVSRLFPLATVVTPNLPETAKLLGLGDENGRPRFSAAVAEAAKRLSGLGAAWVLVKGGHAVSGFADAQKEMAKGKRRRRKRRKVVNRSTSSSSAPRAPSPS